jgi:hypothetical protein
VRCPQSFNDVKQQQTVNYTEHNKQCLMFVVDYGNHSGCSTSSLQIYQIKQPNFVKSQTVNYSYKHVNLRINRSNEQTANGWNDDAI